MINKALLLMFFCFLLAACSGSDGDVRDIPAPDSNNPEIRLKADVWQMMEGTRATTYDNAAALQGEESGFTCYAYNANSIEVNTDAGINGSNVKWNSTNSAWEFQDGPDPHRWPSSGDLDFFCYMPATAALSTDAPYISGITYSATDAPSHTVAFSCDMTKTVNKEFVFALALGKNKSNAGSGVSLTFLHPFARIRFKLSEASGTNVKINSITLGGEVYYKTADYSYTFDGSTATSKWDTSSGVQGAFGTCNLNVDYLVIPNNYGSQTLTVNATWTELSAVENVDVSASVAFNWEAGHSYTYTLKLKDYILIVDTDKFTEQW